MIGPVKILSGVMLVAGFGGASAAQAAASGAGELGGTTTRDNEPAHFYGYNIGALNLHDPLYASGVIRTTTSGGSYNLGFFRGADSYNANGGGNPKNFIGYYMDEGYSVWAIVHRNDAGGNYSQASALNLPFGPSAQTAWFTMSYDPAGNGGGGTLTLNVNGNQHVHNLAGGIKNTLLDFTHFGILGQSLNGSSGTRYWDDFTFTTSFAPPSGSVWNGIGDADWFAAGNWTGAVPNAIGAQANFTSGGGTITENFNTNTDSSWERLNNRTAPQNYGWSNTDNTGAAVTPPPPPSGGAAGSLVYAQNPITLGTLRFSDDRTYLLDGAGSLTMQMPSGSALIEVLQGTHKINLPLTIANNTNLAVSAGATLRISDPITVVPGRVLTQSGPGMVLYEANVTLQTGADMEIDNFSHVAALTMATGSAMVLGSSSASGLMADTLNLSGTAQLDLGDDDLLVNGGTSLTTVKALIASGFNGGAQGGSGITTSAAGAGQRLGYAEAADLGLTDFFGQALNSGAILVALVSAGDTDLDGDVDLSDLGNLATSYGAAAGGIWTEGDFDYDGDVDLSDLGALATYYDGGEAQAYADFQSIFVPEPSICLSAILLAGSAMIGRHRTRGK